MERLPEFIGNHLFLVTLFIALLSLLLWNLFGSVMTGVAQISPAELIRLMNHENAVVVDVRSAEDFAAGHILNAVNIPDSDMNKRQQELEKYKQQPVITCCGSGTVSARSARFLKMQGFAQVSTLNGGLQAWQGANFPVARAGS